ncbi:hypothetical protein IW261DRAFT_1610687 [Armillaria novae-zelandiae]|uniref:Uncharacterized protein n=1 Tax=Armillaria novae-zelandiae TaxID=153914 RepID=A0AA39TZI1_9AGAR|nr:hypothetical protein IW261DRAFT_1610687 [Armillaria novae-zelandiae]
MTQAPPSFNTRYQLAPPVDRYFTFSIDVEATLDLYCDGGDEVMKQKLEGIQNRQYAGYCTEIIEPDGEHPKYHVINMRPVQQGLTKPHPRKPRHARPTMCVPILPAIVHPRNREPLRVVNGPLPWDNCYHPTCYDYFVRIPMEWRDYLDSPFVYPSPVLDEAIVEDSRYGELLRAGLDDDRISRVIDGQEDGPGTDDTSETDSQVCKTLLAKIPGIDKPEEDCGFVPVMRIDHVLSNVPEISDPSELHGDLNVFLAIVEEYQLARYGSILLYPPEEPEFDDMSIPEIFSMTYSLTSSGSYSSLPEALDSDQPDSHTLDLSSVDESGESEQLPVSAPGRKGKWRVKSLFRRVITDIVQFVKRHKFSTKL